MDVPRIDAVAKALAGGRLSRRAVMHRLGRGGAAATVVGAAAVGGVGGWRVVEARAASAEEEGCCDGCCPERSEDEEIVVREGTWDALPESSPETVGRLRLLTDYDRAVWLDSGEGWVSQRGEVFDVRAFGARGDGTTDDWAAFHEAIDAMTSRLEEDSTSAYGRTLYVPPGVYRLAQSLILDRAIRLVGAGAEGRFTDSVLLFDPGIAGVIVAEAEPGITGRPGRRGDGSIVERLRIEAAATAPAGGETPVVPAIGTEGTEGGDEPAIHGVWLRTRASVRDCLIAGFDSDGIHVSVATVEPGEATSWEVRGCRVERCGGRGLATLGGGGGVCALLVASGNGAWAIEDDSERGNTYVQCWASGNGSGAFASGEGTNRSLFLGCASVAGQPRSVFGGSTVVVGGDHGAGFEGGNAWTATGARMLLLAQEPGSGDGQVPTVPTLHIRGAAGQTQPHLRIADQAGAHLTTVDAAGRVFVGPAEGVAVEGGAFPPPPVGQEGTGVLPVQVQISSARDGEAAIRWLALNDEGGWAAQARAYGTGSSGPDDPTGGDGRLTFQTAGGAGVEVDTLTLTGGRVGIGTVTPQPAAALEVASTTAGFLPPRLTTEQRDAISAPSEGLIVYNASTRRLNFHDGEAWREVTVTDEDENEETGG